MKEEEEISKYGKTLSEMTDEIDRSSEAIKNRIAESEEYISTAGAAEAQMAQDLSDRYFELAKKDAASRYSFAISAAASFLASITGRSNRSNTL